MIVRSVDGLLGIKIPLVLSSGGIAEPTSTSPVVIRLGEGNFVGRPGNAWFGHNTGIFFDGEYGDHWLLRYEWEGARDEAARKSIKKIRRLKDFVIPSVAFCLMRPRDIW
ncbi:hypothetical protein CC2G_000136 [Coprinopsis cinerea AmutBmut pab1-1]|nr:hypothetical protein CC2G_000136 [Coprinopsis cinerea AmutBmut pab1-1]